MAGVAAPPPGEPDIEMFSRTGCTRCAAAKRFLEELQAERPELSIVISDVGKSRDALERLERLVGREGTQLGVPAFHVRGVLLVGFFGVETTGARVRFLLDQRSVGQVPQAPEASCPAGAGVPCGREDEGRLLTETVELPVLGVVSPRRLGLPAFTIAIGLIDGFNPCAMWVLLFVLSLLVNLHDRLKMFLIGGTFVLVSGLAYFSFMAAWLNVFLLIGLSRPARLGLGALAMLVGSINLKDFFAFGRGISLGIPEAAKPSLYARVRGIVQAENLVAAILGAIVLAVLVNSVELLCTAGLPVVYTQVLAMWQLPAWRYYGYLLLYNVAYMLDDSVMLAVAIVTLSQHKLQERGGRWLKLTSGAVMLLLGFLLMAKPEWLR